MIPPPNPCECDHDCDDRENLVAREVGPDESDVGVGFTEEFGEEAEESVTGEKEPAEDSWFFDFFAQGIDDEQDDEAFEKCFDEL